jgi:peptidoglycan/LPS O-acetylase OafA/YrhL
MGVLRFVLACAVLNVHAKTFGRVPIGGDTAVQLFFIISGFYMAMVLNEKYVPGRATNLDFWKSRALRIFPAYYTVLAAVLAGGAIAFVAGAHLPPFDAWNHLLKDGQSSAHLIFLAAAQLTLLGLDAFNFVAIGGHNEMVFTPKFWQETFPVWRTLFVPQAWTLSLELYFYLLAPFLVRKSLSTLVSILLASFLLRALAALFGYRTDPWSYRVFPFELLFFLAGVLAYRLGKPRGQCTALAVWSLRCLIAILIFGAGAIGRIGISGQSFVLAPGLMALLFLIISHLFELTKSSRADRLLGELSYPLYVCHVLIVWLLGVVLSPEGRWNRVLAPLLSVSVAAVIYWCIDKRIDDLRHRRIDALPQRPIDR